MKRVFITAGLACALAAPPFAAAQSADQPVRGQAGATGQGGTAVATPAIVGQAKAGTAQDHAAGSAALAASDKAFAMSAAAFDRAYMAIMFQRTSTTAKNADLKARAGKTLPTLKEHQQMARDVSDKVRGGSSGHPSAPAGHTTDKPESPSGRK